MKSDIAFWVVGSVATMGLIVGSLYLKRSFNEAYLHTQVINPKPGIECMVVRATDSISVDCWGM